MPQYIFHREQQVSRKRFYTHTEALFIPQMLNKNITDKLMTVSYTHLNFYLLYSFYWNYLYIMYKKADTTQYLLFYYSSFKYFAIVLIITVDSSGFATRIIRSMSREDAKTIPIIAMTANAVSYTHLAESRYTYDSRTYKN